MSDTKFTPGHWKVDISRGDWGMPITRLVYVGDAHLDKDNQIACIDSNQPYCAGASKKDIQQYVKEKANARLIAAAPDLYTVLSQIRTDMEAQDALFEWWGAVDAALAKARGEG